jgi:hypothetical protein
MEAFSLQLQILAGDEAAEGSPVRSPHQKVSEPPYVGCYVMAGNGDPPPQVGSYVEGRDVPAGRLYDEEPNKTEDEDEEDYEHDYDNQ